MGTPVEHDDEAEAVIDHLNAEGGISIGTSPRVLVRGRYEGGGAVLQPSFSIFRGVIQQ